MLLPERPEAWRQARERELDDRPDPDAKTAWPIPTVAATGSDDEHCDLHPVRAAPSLNAEPPRGDEHQQSRGPAPSEAQM
jgi:hypothetical protein